MLPAGLPMTRRAAIVFYRAMLAQAAERGEADLREARRWLCRNDLFYLLVVVLRRRDINRDWLFARCREVQAEPNGCLDLWSREHYKSTIITWGLTIQDILASHGEKPEARYGGREITVGIFSHTRPIAKAFLVQIKREFEDNGELKGLFPDILWSKPEAGAPKWSEDGGLIVRRRTNLRARLRRGTGGNTSEGVFSLRCRRDAKAWSEWKRKGLGRRGENDMFIEMGGFGCGHTWQFEWSVTDDCPVELVRLDAQVTLLGE